MNVNIVHVTSAHPRFDVRIYRKQCNSLAEMGYQVSLVVADGKGAVSLDGINIIDVGKPASRIHRMIFIPWKIFSFIHKSKDTKIFHLHDPELIPMGLVLRMLGKKVIFDSHEDVCAQIKSKEYLSPILARIISIVYSIFEYCSLRHFSLVVAATPEIGNKLRKFSKSLVVVNNYPIVPLKTQKRKRDYSTNICYVGRISELRGAIQLVKAMEFTSDGVHLLLAGKISEELLENLSQLPSWRRCTYLGEVDASAVQEIYDRSKIGIATYLEAPNHNKSQPNKIYEYMSASLPIICSSFPKWNSLIAKANSGVTVDPSSPELIGKTINKVLNLRNLKELGENGFEFVEKRANWDSEKDNLLSAYKEIIKC